MNDVAAESSTLTARVADRLFGLLDNGAAARRAHFAAHPEERPTPGQIDAIISSYANTNALISGGFSLVPGPLGLLAVVPELALVVRNQVQMVYDIGVASGKEHVLSRELIVAVVVSATGAGTLGLVTLHGGRLLVRRASLRVFQKLVKLLAGRITQALLKSAFAKWVPVLGAGAVALWTRYTTQAIGRRAKEMFAVPVDMIEADAEGEEPAPRPEADPVAVFKAKVLLLANLVQVDGRVADAERVYLDALLSFDAAPRDVVDELRRKIESPLRHDVDLSVFNDPDEALGLVMDMVALARRDGDFDGTERLYIREVAKKLPVQAPDIDLLTA